MCWVCGGLAASTGRFAVTLKERRFVEAYTSGDAAGNSAAAARYAGYSVRTAGQLGSRLLKKVEVRAAIEAETLRVRQQSEQERQADVATRQKRQQFWTEVMEGKFDGVSMKDRLKASELLGRSQADFTDVHQHEFPDLEGMSEQDLRRELAALLAQ